MSPGSVETPRVTVSWSGSPSRGPVLATPKSRIFAWPSVVMNRLAGFEIAVHDAVVVRRGEAPRNLRAIIGHLTGGQGAAAKPRLQRLAPEQLAHNVGRAVGRADVVHGQDVRMIERGCRACFLLEPPEPIGIGPELLREQLHRDVAAETRIASAIHLAHAARAERRGDFIRAETRTQG